MASLARAVEDIALAGDPARIHMLRTLMDGRALTASELARSVGVTPQAASEHLAGMIAAGVVQVEQQGRHRYHRLATPAVARMLESVLPANSGWEPMRPPPVTGPRDSALRAARTCYGHLAGRLGVALMDALVTRGYVESTRAACLTTDAGIALFGRIGIEVASLSRKGGRTDRAFCRPCLDWSERRPHLAGAVGAALCARSFEEDWIRRVESTRAVTVTPKGMRVFRDTIGVRFGAQ